MGRSLGSPDLSAHNNGPVYLPHPESDGETGWAGYDLNSRYFTCTTCEFELPGRDLTVSCPCGGVRRFDGDRRVVCDRKPRDHWWDLTDPTPEQLTALGDAAVDRMNRG